MREDLIKELKSLAREILLLKEDTSIEKLHLKVQKIHEKLIVAEYLDAVAKEEIVIYHELNPDAKTPPEKDLAPAIAKSIIPETETTLGEEKNTTNNLEIKAKPIIEEAEAPKNEVVSEIKPKEKAEIPHKVEDKKEINTENEVTQEEKTKSIATTLKEEIIPVEDKIKAKTPKKTIPKKEKKPVNLEDLFVPNPKKKASQLEEFKDIVSLDETEKMFTTKKEDLPPKSLNDKLVGNNINVGLNDRIAFVNKLFNFSQSEFNKVLQDLNGFNSKQEAINYIEYSVKTKYNWKGKEDLEERFILLIERKFI